MDPYLEDPEVWPDVHHELISTIRQLLNQQIRPKYIARVEERIYMVPDDDPEHRFWKVADVKVHRHSSTATMRSNGAIAIAEPVVLHQSDAIREGRVEIQEVASRRVVTVIEVLSPSNKLKRAAGRRSFMKKRREVMSSKANWVEIDLLRTGTSHPSKSRFPTCQYFVYSSPAVMRPDAKAWPMAIEEPLPTVGIPLRKPDPDAPLDLQAALDLAYDRAAYEDMVDYTKDPVPPLPPDLAKWANKLLKQKKLR
jgi:hypothetical protein